MCYYTEVMTEQREGHVNVELIEALFLDNAGLESVVPAASQEGKLNHSELGRHFREKLCFPLSCGLESVEHCAVCVSMAVPRSLHLFTLGCVRRVGTKHAL